MYKTGKNYRTKPADTLRRIELIDEVYPNLIAKIIWTGKLQPVFWFIE
jgi:hypothetical protein